jgi:hypothetical protein
MSIPRRSVPATSVASGALAPFPPHAASLGAAPPTPGHPT